MPCVGEETDVRGNFQIKLKKLWPMAAKRPGAEGPEEGVKP
jgi:hypothetical protein